MKLISRFRFPSIRFNGKYDEEFTSSFIKETDVNQEYKKAFRTQSYTDICNKVQTSSSSIRDLCYNLTNTFNLHHLLVDFFVASLKSWMICEELLDSIHQVNANHQKFKQIIKLVQIRVPYDTKIYEELASYSSLVNPLSEFDPEKFPTLHIDHKLLFKKLTTKHMRIKRKRKIINFFKKTSGCALVASYAILVVALLVLACHGLIVTVASPGLFACLFGVIKNTNLAKKRVKPSELKRVGAQLDVAAKGVYTMIKDLDTMGCLVGRLHNEVEFGKAMAYKCCRTRKADVWEEVMREFRVHESCLLEQLEELEDHIYLCLLNVNRSRKLLAAEIVPISEN
ncbi:hypothetical protein L1987_79063 [Smallanthus sonchifolius]|uniref:Uncharacterized protein n=1 Tax=Smallanthus sonchifolius TaxID=185202 RepID=A0ACB8ZFE7_9ASTR|nr:hypothetical protein L1987_79063 [Smallanthus sonchifolius]